MEENRKLWIVIVVLGAVVVGVGSCCCVTGIWGLSTQPEYDLEVETARRDGERDGASGSTDSCLSTGYDRTSLCSTTDPDCITYARTYMLACLSAVRDPSPDLCVGAPATPGFLADPTFSAALCGRYGWGETDGCYDVVAAVETHCATNARLGPRAIAEPQEAPVDAPVVDAPVELDEP